jgi:hypothetical protein
MKKITYLLLITFSIVNQLNAQFSVKRIDGTPFTNNEVIEFTSYNQNVSSTLADLKFIVTNTSAQNLKMRIRCNQLINTTGANFQLCFGSVCFNNVTIRTTYPDYDYEIPASGSNDGSGDAFKNFNPGDGTNYPCDYTFEFFALDQNGNQVGSNIILTYRYMGPNMSVEQKDKLSTMGVKVLNNVANQFIGLEITKPVQYEIVNLQGQIITTKNIAENTNIDVSSYQTGLYFLNFKNQEGLSDAVKIFKK